jgi:hypothetical protein
MPLQPTASLLHVPALLALCLAAYSNYVVQRQVYNDALLRYHQDTDIRI